ncbi:glucooligosaccharide oxidase [Fusarium heterosporum]|uniref:Glucooligosaccharide oxidase n=1 Tax=Fusarium heterosporum TaxID=42747 RepID=A0A8H5TWU0_FUSHE|nr:glucooligosaccharide oxidase [Fusarium heterosporum]
MFSRYEYPQEKEATEPLITKSSSTLTRKSNCQYSLSLFSFSPCALKVLASILCGLCILNVIVTTIPLPWTNISSLTSCLADSNVPFIVEGAAAWERSITPWNVRLTYTPAAVAIPDTIEQIQIAVNCGIKNKVRVTAKGGGHSFGSYGLGGEDGHLVVELQQLNDVTLFENGTARIQPGASIGLAGHALHGGYGAGSSFGIVAELEFKTFEAPKQVTPFTIELPWTEEAAFDTLSALQDFALVAPQTLNLFLSVTATSQIIQGLYFGDKGGLLDCLQPLLERLGTTVSNMETIGWLEGLYHYADNEPIHSPSPYNTHGSFYTSSLTTPALTEEQMESLISAMFLNINDTSARHPWDIVIEMHGGPNSAVSQVDSPATAYVHRDKVLLWQLSDSSEQDSLPRESFAMLKKFMNSVTRSLSDDQWGMYANFIVTELDGKTAQDLYWGKNLPRLKALKTKFDPNNIFWNPQGITPVVELGTQRSNYQQMRPSD